MTRFAHPQGQGSRVEGLEILAPNPYPLSPKLTGGER